MPTLYTFFFFNDTATTEIYTLSLHDALPISPSRMSVGRAGAPGRGGPAGCGWNRMMQPCASTLAPAGVWGHLSRLSGTPSPSSSPGWARTTSFDTGHPLASTLVPGGVLGHLSSASGTPSPSESLPIGQPVESTRVPAGVLGHWSMPSGTPS